MGLRLYHVFQAAGLKKIGARGENHTGGGPNYHTHPWLAHAVASLAPTMEKFGVTTVAELKLDGLAERMNAEAVRLGATVQSPPLIAAWGRT